MACESRVEGVFVDQEYQIHSWDHVSGWLWHDNKSYSDFDVVLNDFYALDDGSTKRMITDKNGDVRVALHGADEIYR